MEHAAALRYCSWRADMLTSKNQKVSLADLIALQDEVLDEDENPDYFLEEAKAILEDKNSHPLRVYDHCFLMMPDPYIEGRAVTEHQLDSPLAESPYVNWEYDEVMKHIDLSAVRLSVAKETDTNHIARLLAILGDKDLTAISDSLQHHIDLDKVTTNVIKQMNEHYGRNAGHLEHPSHQHDHPYHGIPHRRGHREELLRVGCLRHQP